MSEFQIEAGVPIPPPSSGGRAYKYPFAGMQIGDSFAIPLTGEMHRKGGDTAYVRLKNASKRYERLHGGSFRVRTRRDENAVRCWRVA